MATDALNGADAPPTRSVLLVDWGGVMTSSPFASFSAFCEAEGLDPSRLASMFRADVVARELLISFEEGRIADAEFELALAERARGARSRGPDRPPVRRRATRRRDGRSRAQGPRGRHQDGR